MENQVKGSDIICLILLMVLIACYLVFVIVDLFFL